MNVSGSLDQSIIAKVSGAILDYLDKYNGGVAKVSGAMLLRYRVPLCSWRLRNYTIFTVPKMQSSISCEIEHLVRRGARDISMSSSFSVSSSDPPLHAETMVIDILSILSPHPSHAIIYLLLQQQCTHPDSVTFSPIFSIMNFFSKLAFFGLFVGALLSTDSGVSARLLGPMGECMKDCLRANKDADVLNGADVCRDIHGKDSNVCMKEWKAYWEEEATNGIGGWCRDISCADDLP
jgi:hypothetical protein